MKCQHECLHMLPENCCCTSSIAVFSFSAAITLQGLFQWPYILIIFLIVALAVGISTAYFLRKKKKKPSPLAVAPLGNPPQPKLKGLAVAKFELTENSLKFFAKKGLRKKRMVVFKEMPIGEIANIEQVGNVLSVTWKDKPNNFVMEKTAGSFGNLSENVKAMIEEQRVASEKKVKADLRKGEVTKALNASLDIVDLSFDVLVSLQEKRVNWKMLESYSAGFSAVSFTGQTMEPLSLDLSNLLLAIRNRSLKETSEQSYCLLKQAHGYFIGLNAENDIGDSHPNFKDAKALISAYYLLNDLLFGKVVDDKEGGKEASQLKMVLQSLAKETNASVKVDAFKAVLDKADSQKDRENAFEESRALFREQFKDLLLIS